MHTIYIPWKRFGISATWCGTVWGWPWWIDSRALRTRTWRCRTAGARTGCRRRQHPRRTRDWTRIWRSVFARGTGPNRWKTPQRRPLKNTVEKTLIASRIGTWTSDWHLIIKQIPASKCTVKLSYRASTSFFVTTKIIFL